jgi:hypothetical protein
LKQMEQQGMTEQGVRDPQRRGQMFNVMRTIMTDLQKRLSERTGELSDLNRRTLRTIDAMVAAEHARSIRSQFYQQGYPEIIAGNKGNTAERALDMAVKFQELTDEQRETLNVIASEYHSSLSRLGEQAMDAIDEHRKKQNIFDFDGEARQKFQEQLTSLREKRTTLNDNTLDSLRSALGGPESELVARIEKRLKEGGASQPQISTDAVMVVGGPAGAGAAVSVRRFEGRAAVDADAAADPFVPSAISKRDLEIYARQLGVSAEERTVLDALHEDYREQYQALEGDGGAIKAVREAERGMWSVGPTGQVSPQDPKAIDDLYALRKKATDSVTELDRQFFEDVSVTLGDEKTAIIERLRSARHRQVLVNAAGSANASFGAAGGRDGRRGGMRMVGLGGSGGEASVDISALASSLEMAPDDRTQFDAVLLEYESAALAAFQKLYDANLRMRAARDKMVAQSMRAEGIERSSRATACEV